MDTNINVEYSFTSDTKGYLETFDKLKTSRGCPDPDSHSKTLRNYHKVLWSKNLQNGDKMELHEDATYLAWKNFRFGSDSIVNMYFHHYYAQPLLTDELKTAFCKKYGFRDFTSFWRDYLIKSYTIGGAIIFPKSNSINVARGRILKDRFDLTLECIRLYYLREESPLFSTLKANENFFNLFADFEDYVDFFYLQDLVFDKYSKIKYFNQFKDLYNVPYPQTIQDWMDLYDNQLDFVRKRNQRIKEDMLKYLGNANL